MDLIKITKISRCLLERGTTAATANSQLLHVTVHLTDQRLLIIVNFSSDDGQSNQQQKQKQEGEIWLPYQNILTFERKSSQVCAQTVFYPLRILTRDMMHLKLMIPNDSDARDLYQSIYQILYNISRMSFHSFFTSSLLPFFLS
jgi:hypothetical protein